MEYQKIVKRQKKLPNPMGIWLYIETPRYLSDLALYLLQAVSNSAAIERLFNIWDHLDISKANGQKPQKIIDIACIKADINSHH